MILSNTEIFNGFKLRKDTITPKNINGIEIRSGIIKTYNL